MGSSRNTVLKMTLVAICSSILSSHAIAKGGSSTPSPSPSPTPSAPSSPGGIKTQLASGYTVTLRSYTAAGAGSPTRTTNDPFFSNMVSMAMMSQQSYPGSGNFSAMEAYSQCRAQYPNGQFKVTAGPTVKIVVQTYAREFTAYGVASCIPGSYTAMLGSNELGASSASFMNGPKTIGATVCLTENAPSNTVVQLASYQPTVASVPASVTILAGQRCATYVVTVKGMADTWIHAKLNGYWISPILRVGY